MAMLLPFCIINLALSRSNSLYFLYHTKLISRVVYTNKLIFYVDFVNAMSFQLFYSIAILYSTIYKKRLGSLFFIKISGKQKQIETDMPLAWLIPNNVKHTTKTIHNNLCNTGDSILYLRMLSNFHPAE